MRRTDHWIEIKCPWEQLRPFGTLNVVTENNRQAIESVQSSAPQTLTDSAATALFQTPTLSYGEVGKTLQVELKGNSVEATSVGEFTDTKILERMALLADLNWTSASSGLLSQIDVMNALANVTRNKNVLNQFGFMRAGVEVSVRINATQFYYGALAVTLIPTQGTGANLDERMVIDPTIISACNAQAVIKKWDYGFPQAWMDIANVTGGGNNMPVFLNLDILAPLTVVSTSAAETVSVQVWARFTDVKLAYPTTVNSRQNDVKYKGKEFVPSFESSVKFEAQMSKPKVKLPKKGMIQHPMDEDPDVVGLLMDTIQQLKAPEEPTSSGGIIDTLISWAPIALGAAALFLDKPNQTDNQMAVIQEPQRDMYACDIPDTNCSLSLYKSKYLDPSIGRMPLGKSMTVSDYARIAGLRRSAVTLTSNGQTVTIFLIQAHPDNTTLRIPLDFACLSAVQWRGSVKVVLQFWTSSFISTRVSVQFVNINENANVPVDYTAGLTRVVDIKGDTVDCFMCPWLSQYWWKSTFDPTIVVTVISDIVSTDITTAPKIYMNVWVAGGEDIQFAYPRIPLDSEWSGAIPNKEFEAQSSIGTMFKETFPPIGEGVNFQTDLGHCTTEQLGPITDICKRYALMPWVTGTATPLNGVIGYVLDLYANSNATNTVAYTTFYRFRKTYYGSWRQAFLFRSGSTRYRAFITESAMGYNLTKTSLGTTVQNISYQKPTDGVVRMTVPQVAYTPYCYLGNTVASDFFGNLNFLPQATLSTSDTEYLAAGDDLQFGFPILPAYVHAPTLAEVKEKELDKENPRDRRISRELH